MAKNENPRVVPGFWYVVTTGPQHDGPRAEVFCNLDDGGTVLIATFYGGSAQYRAQAVATIRNTAKDL